MTRHGRVDKTQSEVIERCLHHGGTIQNLADVGKGCPDFAWGWMGRNYFIEVKNGTGAKLRQTQIDWHAAWEGQVVVLRNSDEVDAFVQMIVLENNNDQTK